MLLTTARVLAKLYTCLHMGLHTLAGCVRRHPKLRIGNLARDLMLCTACNASLMEACLAKPLRAMSSIGINICAQERKPSTSPEPFLFASCEPRSCEKPRLRTQQSTNVARGLDHQNPLWLVSVLDGTQTPSLKKVSQLQIQTELACYRH